jgi:hypothetical protein
MGDLFKDLKTGLDEVDASLSVETKGYKVNVPAKTRARNVANDLVEAMREAAAIAEGKAEPAAVHQFPLALDIDVRAVRKATGLSRTVIARRPEAVVEALAS